jgi:hypothetical protein
MSNISGHQLPKRHNQKMGIERFSSLGKAKEREAKAKKKTETLEDLLSQPIPKNIKEALDVDNMLKSRLNI